MLTTDDVLRAFDSLGGSVEQAKALQMRLQQRTGADIKEVIAAINTALDSGFLVKTPQGGLRRP